MQGSLHPQHPVLGTWPGATLTVAGYVRPPAPVLQVLPAPPPPRAPAASSGFWSGVAMVVLGAAGGAVTGALIAKGVAYAREDPETRAIRRSAERHVRRGAVVRADLPGWRQPPTIRHHRPDVHAKYPTHTEVEEYENELSVERSHARSQDRAFTAHASRARNVRYTQIVVEGGRGGHG